MAGKSRSKKSGIGRAFNANFDTVLSPTEEQNYQSWKAKVAPYEDAERTYDLRGAFLAGEGPHPEAVGESQGHWTDRFKKPNHETFSKESQYAPFVPALLSGNWMAGDRFYPGEMSPLVVNAVRPGGRSQRNLPTPNFGNGIDAATLERLRQIGTEKLVRAIPSGDEK